MYNKHCSKSCCILAHLLLKEPCEACKMSSTFYWWRNWNTINVKWLAQVTQLMAELGFENNMLNYYAMLYRNMSIVNLVQIRAVCIKRTEKQEITLSLEG